MNSAKAALQLCKELDQSLRGLPGVRPTHTTGVVRPALSARVTDVELYAVASKLYQDGHYTRAVEEAFKFLNALVKERTNVTPPRDGADLMRFAFSPKNPILKLNPCTTESEINEQTGYMEIMAGCMTGIRNPRAHDHKWKDSQDLCLELLGLANHLVERCRMATKT